MKNLEFDWKPKSGFLYEKPDGSQGFSPMPKLRITVTRRWGKQTYQRSLVRTRKRKNSGKYGVPDTRPEKYFSWSIGHVRTETVLMEDGSTEDQEKWVAEERLTNAEAIRQLAAAAGVRQSVMEKTLNAYA